MAPFCRELIEWALDYYEEAESLFMLKRAYVEVPHLKTKKK